MTRRQDTGLGKQGIVLGAGIQGKGTEYRARELRYKAGERDTGLGGKIQG